MRNGEDALNHEAKYLLEKIKIAPYILDAEEPQIQAPLVVEILEFLDVFGLSKDEMKLIIK